MNVGDEAYREMLDIISERYPGRSFLRPAEVAAELGCNIKTVRAAIERKHNPLPARNISTGIRNKSYVVPIASFIRWSLGRRV